MASDIAAPLIHPEGDLEPSPLSAQRAAAGAVARDLEAIFGASPAPEAERPPPRSSRRDTAAAEPRGSRLAALGGLAAAAFLGVAAGAFLMTDHAPGSAKALPHALPVEIAAAKPAPAPGPIDPLAGQAAPAAIEAAPAVATPLPVARSLPSPRRHAARACCGYVQMAAADRRLRAAYAEAVRAGAPRPLLVTYRDRWAEVRRRGAHEPRRLVEGYSALARELDRAAAEARAHPRRYAERRSWRPRYAPWWS